ncbi:hypothetical protein AAVH_13272 [Aphelenchoides avenae]|nr:hypothetical protein AAVH_13272 [Aphelenchus avenae]
MADQCDRTDGYIKRALLGSVILVLTAISPLVACGASYGVAQVACPGYNSTLDWVGQELGLRERGVSVYVLAAVSLCVHAPYAYLLGKSGSVLLHGCLLKVYRPPTSTSALRSRLIMSALAAHFRRIFLLVLFLAITVLAVYPLVLLQVPSLTGIMFAQLLGFAALVYWNVALLRRYQVIMRLPESAVAAATMNAKACPFKEPGRPGI